MLRETLLLIATFIRNVVRVRPEQPPKLLSGDNGTDTITVEVYQSERLTAKNGRAPEEVVAPALADAFDAASVSYEIRRSHPSIDVSEDTPTSDTLAEFRSENRMVDSRLLLLDAPGGGKGELAGVYCVMGANNIDERFRPDLASTPLSGRSRNVRGAIHEVGHTLGGRHTTPILADAPTMAYSSPMVAQIQHYLETGEADAN